MFSQVDSALDRSEGGLGIGLALVKGLVTLHGGTVEATSPGVGLGSEFTIRLPAAIVVTPTPAADEKAAAVPAEPGAADSGSCILVADDNRDAADSLALVLEMTGHRVFSVHSGTEALAALLRHRPQVAILDIGMPDLTGYEVAEAVRREPWGRSMHLIAVTGWGQTEDKERAHAAGFDQHLTKPVDPDRVEALLRELHRGRRRA
jgi:CheY-like chemotaxis protein